MAEQQIHYGAYPEEWDHFCTLGLQEYLLPVVSAPDAKASPNSSLKQLGKVPSRYNKQGFVVGISSWTTHVASKEDIDRWSGNDHYGMCVQTKKIRALDLDLADKALCRAIIKFIVDLGYRFPARIRSNSGKALLAFMVEGELPKRTMKVEGGVIEFLGNGQQFVACGTHPSGVRYEWATNNGPELPNNFPTISLTDFEEIWSALTKNFAIEAPITGSGARKNDPSDNAKALQDPVIHFLASQGEILEYGRNGEAHISCPWKNEHTTDNGPTETTYFPAGTRGYKQGHWKCLHAHCAERTDNDFLEKLGYYISDFQDLTTPEEKTEETKKRERFDLIKANEFIKRPPVRWLIKHILPRGETMSYGASGCGKTFAILDMACHLALGMDWNGRRTIRTPVTYICAEGAGGFVSRLMAWAQRYCISLDDIADYLGIIPDTPNFLDEKEVKQLAEKIKAHYGDQHSFTVVDTFAQVTAGADENSGQDMSKALRHAKWLGAMTNSTYHLIHHAGKDEERGLRGWSGLKGQLDALFHIYKIDDTHTFWIDKLKDARDNFGFNFKLETETLGHDDDGDAITSCSVEYSTSGPAPEKKKQIKHGRWQRIVLDAWEALGGGNVLIEDVMAEVLSAVPQDPKKRDRRREGVYTAIQNLADEDLFTVRDNAIWVDLKT